MFDECISYFRFYFHYDYYRYPDGYNIVVVHCVCRFASLLIHFGFIACDIFSRLLRRFASYNDTDVVTRLIWRGYFISSDFIERLYATYSIINEEIMASSPKVPRCANRISIWSGEWHLR